MNSSTSKDFLLILSFLRYLKRPSIISSLLLSAISLCSEVRGFCHRMNAEATETPRNVKAGTFPWYPAQCHWDNNIKLALLRLNLL